MVEIVVASLDFSKHNEDKESLLLENPNIVMEEVLVINKTVAPTLREGSGESNENGWLLNYV